jgi:2-polyprenyl-6-methoxyphenol hydroxylase-like FAD-dependent oxidoreductase
MDRPFFVPALQETAMNPAALIVGAGPVGLTMAAELTRFGVPVRIIDKNTARTDKSKALVLWSRSLELIDRMGSGDSFVDAGLKVTTVNLIAGSHPVAHIQFDGTDTPHPYALMIPQSETERLMETHLNTRGVQVERQVELTQFTPSPDGVTATLHHADGRNETLTAQWLIGCDGAHSTVRHGLNMPFEGNTQPSDWILADLHLTGLAKPDELNMYWHSDGVLAIFPISPGRYRIITDAGDAKTQGPRPDPTLDEIQSVLDRRGPGGVIASDPIWLASFRINERKVADYRSGRVFLAGDAAHVHSPAGGQGMNTGMQDAFNLAWKLALVHHGHATPEPLLESYSLERSAVGRQVLADAGRLTTLAIIKGGVLQSIRNHAVSLVFGLSAVRNTLANKFTELSIGYPHSPLTVPARHGHGHPAPGERAPVSRTSVPVGSGDAPRFALFAPSSAAADVFAARHRSLLEQQPRPPLTAGFIHLVRPDGYIALVTTPDNWYEVEAYLHTIHPLTPCSPSALK